MPLTPDAPAASLLLQLGACAPLDAALAGLNVAIGQRRFVAREVVVPGQALWAVRAGLRGHVVAPAEWALLPPWPATAEPHRPQYVARTETLLERPSFRPRALRYRALVPVTGFYLRPPAGAAGNRHYRDLFRPRHHGALLLGALYGHNVDGNQQIAVMTCPADRRAQTGTRRMPLVVAPEHAAAWLQATDELGLQALLAAARLPVLHVTPLRIEFD